MTKTRLILLVFIIIGVWYFWGRNRQVNGPPQPAQVPAGQELQSDEEAETNPSLPPLTLRGGEVGEGKARVHYFTKEALAACSTETVALDQTVDPKYGHPASGALVAMTLPMSQESSAQYVSALAPGTRLLTMRIDKEGVATANYNSMLREEENDCNKAQRRAQIEKTLREFSEIKSVRITVEGEVGSE